MCINALRPNWTNLQTRICPRTCPDYWRGSILRQAARNLMSGRNLLIGGGRLATANAHRAPLKFPLDHAMKNVVLPTLAAPIALAGLLCLLGCAEKKLGDDRATAPPAVQPTDDDCLKFAKLLEKAAKSRDVAAFNQMIDWEAIVSRATTPPEGSEAFNEMFMLQTKRDLMNPSYGIAATTAKLIGEGGDFRCLRIHTMDGAKRVVFRLLAPKKPSLDYLEFVLARRADGAVIANDYYTFRTGEMVSQHIRENYRQIASATSKVLQRSKLTRDESDLVANIRKVSEMEAFAASGDGRRALEIYAQLPETMRNEKGALLTRLSAANSLGTGGTEYQGDCSISHDPTRTFSRYASSHAAASRLFLMPTLAVDSFFNKPSAARRRMLRLTSA